MTENISRVGAPPDQRGYESGLLVHDQWEILNRHCAGRRVLDVGCVGDYAQIDELRHSLFVRLSGIADVVGVDINEPALEFLRGLGATCLWANASQLSRLDVGQFDVVHCGNIIEHMPNPGDMLAGIRQHLRPGGILLVSTPNALHWLNAVAMLPPRTPRQRLAWSSRGQHTMWFCRITLRNLARFAGYDELGFYFVTYWSNRPRCSRRKLSSSLRSGVERALFRANPELAPQLLGVYRGRESFTEDDVERVYRERWHANAIEVERREEVAADAST
jgi:SAM-dependent methyltransferase